MPRKKLQPFTELAQFELDPNSIQLLSLAFCVRNQMVVLGKVDFSSPEAIHLGMIEPREDAVVRSLALRWARVIVPVQITQYEFNKVLDVGFGTGEAALPEQGYLLDLCSKPADAGASAVELVDDMLLHAIAQRASDVHLETYLGDVDVRLRIDGVLHQLLTHVTPDNVHEVVSRIKVMARLDIVDHRHPQDGRFRATVVDDDGHGHAVDFRVSILPGPHGEDVVIRLRSARHDLLPLDKLGMRPRDAATLRRVLENPEGTVLITGPTGSGKTSTLYAAIGHLQDGQRKILTAEDPVEIFLPKINQKQVGPSLDMADLARAFLRQDPDIVLIGEIRDPETAHVTARAASTGHSARSTLHTPNALGAVPRLRVLGLDDHEIADSLLLVVGQRLARRNCAKCAEPASWTDEQRELLGALAEGWTPSAGRGCHSCRGDGCRGRIGIFELLLLDEELQEAIGDGASLVDLRRKMRERGHRTLLHDALAKAREGLISVEEILRVIPYRQIAAVSRPSED